MAVHTNPVITDAIADDLPAIAKVEYEIWKNEGTDVFSLCHVKSWFDVNPAGFFVAKIDENVIGYAFMQMMLLDPDKLELPSTFIETIGDGFCKKSHIPSGNFHYCVSVCATRFGAGKLLVDAMLSRAAELNKPLIGVSRIVSFGRFIDSVREVNGLVSLDEHDKTMIAWQYAAKTAKIVRGDASEPPSPIRPEIILPDIKRPDPVLAGYLKNRFRMVRPLPDYLHDPKSADFGILCEQISN